MYLIGNCNFFLNTPLCSIIVYCMILCLPTNNNPNNCYYKQCKLIYQSMLHKLISFAENRTFVQQMIGGTQQDRLNNGWMDGWKKWTHFSDSGLKISHPSELLQ